jgi:hypothetical protein
VKDPKAGLGVAILGTLEIPEAISISILEISEILELEL